MLRRLRRFIEKRALMLGLLLGSWMWLVDVFDESNLLKRLPVAFLDSPLVPHPNPITYSFVLACLVFWTVSQLHPRPSRRRWARNDFFNCLNKISPVVRSIISILLGISCVALICFVLTGKLGALHAAALGLMVVAQQAFALAMLFELGKSTKWRTYKFSATSR